MLLCHKSDKCDKWSQKAEKDENYDKGHRTLRSPGSRVYDKNIPDSLDMPEELLKFSKAREG